MIAMIGTVFQIAMDLRKSSMVFGKSLDAVPSTHMQMRSIVVCSFSSSAAFLHHFCTSLMALFCWNILVGSNPIVSMILKGTSSFSYTCRAFVVPVMPIPVSAFVPRMELIRVVLPTPELPKNRMFPFFITHVLLREMFRHFEYTTAGAEFTIY